MFLYDVLFVERKHCLTRHKDATTFTNVSVNK